MPYLAVAAICEKVLREEGGIISMVRLIDTFNITGDSKELPPGVVSFVIYVALKSGEAIGKRTVEITGYSPSGEKIHSRKQEVNFEGGVAGAGVIANVMMTVKETGTYWFHVKLNRQEMTRIPLKINYQRAQKD